MGKGELPGEHFGVMSRIFLYQEMGPEPMRGPSQSGEKPQTQSDDLPGYNLGRFSRRLGSTALPKPPPSVEQEPSPDSPEN